MERVKPEEVGLSSKRLARIDEHLRDRYLEPGKISGCLSLVARRGKLAHCSPLGHMELEAKRPLEEDAIFRIYSMSKPITSVAADRGRKTLYVYGAAKAGLSSFTDGLRGRLHSHGVQVLNIKPGVIDTPMTAHLKKGLLASTPEKLAADVYKAVLKRRDILYTPARWRAIMFVIRHIPERIFKKLTF